MTSDRLLTPRQVAELLGVPEGTLRQWRHHGRGPVSFRVEGHVRYRVSAVEAWLRACEQATARGEEVA